MSGMYTILVNESNELITTVKERIMQRSKLVDDLHFLVEPMYNEHDMNTFTVLMEYLTPVGHEYKSEYLVKSDSLYKNMLEYKLPFDTCLTREAGNVEVQLTFVKVDLDADGNSIQRVRKTSKTAIKILPITAWSDVIADSALTALDQRLIQTQAMIQATEDMVNYLDATKADNITYDKETQSIQLTANGQLIGNTVNVGHIGTNIISIEVDEFGNMIVNYSDGRSENLGQVGNSSCVGVYVPSYSEDGIMTFTLKDNVEDDILTFDINPFNDWNMLDGPEVESTYVWQSL